MIKKILLITPHLSTGGLPQFLLEKIEILKNEFDIYLIEWDNITGGHLVVQRSKIENILRHKLITLGENKEECLQIIKDIKPDIIHFEEFSESFIDVKLLKKIYSNKDYSITETTHGTFFNPIDKLFTPDKLMFVSKCNYEKYSSIADSELIEYPITNKKRDEDLLSLGLDPTYKHVLNVGLFNSNKNQGEIFEIAKQLQDYKIQFHFVGSQAGNFQSYWEPILKNKSDNCLVWGERNDVSSFYKCMDLFLYTSILENRPLSVLEALGYNLPVLMYNLSNYGDDFAKHENVNFLSSNRDSNIRLLLDTLDIKRDIKEQTKTESAIMEKTNDRKISAYHMLTDIDTDREVSSMISLTQLKRHGISYKTCINKRYTELPPVDTCEYPDKVSMEPGGKLTPGHYGCYLAHKGAFYEGIDSDSDYILIFECDCVIDIPYVEFMDKINLACDVLDKTDLLMFSFGFHNGIHILEQNPEYWVVNKFYGAHAYLIPKKSFGVIKDMYENNKWNVTDLLFVEKLDQYKTGIFEVPPTKQAAGYSILDKIYNEDRH